MWCAIWRCVPRRSCAAVLRFWLGVQHRNAQYAASPANAAAAPTRSASPSAPRPANAAACGARNARHDAIMMRALSVVSPSTVTPVFAKLSASPCEHCLWIAFPVKPSRSQRPTQRLPPHATVSSITVLPASVPIPTLTCSCASSWVAPSPEATMTAASGTAPRMGSSSPPTSPGESTSSRSSLPSEMRLAAWRRRIRTRGSGKGSRRACRSSGTPRTGRWWCRTSRPGAGNAGAATGGAWSRGGDCRNGAILH